MAGPGGLLGLVKKDEEEDMGPDLGAMDSSAKEEAATALADAVKGGDSAAIADAFQTMYDLCATKMEEPEEEPEEALDDLEM